jgi:flagellar export protein FliJ
MYRFPLEPVLTVRRNLEEKAERELAVVGEELEAEKRRLAEMEQKERQVRQGLEQKRKNAATASENILYLAFLRRLSTQRSVHEKKILMLEAKHRSKREELIGIMKNRKILEKLKEKGGEVFFQDQQKAQQSFMDEIAIGRFHRKMSFSE